MNNDDENAPGSVERAAEHHLLHVTVRRGTETISAAFDCANVQEVIECPDLDSMPGPPGVLHGLVEVRGLPVPVLSLWDGEAESAAPGRVVVFVLSVGVFGILVSGIDGIRVYSPTALLTIPPALQQLGGLLACDRVVRAEPAGYRFVIDVGRWVATMVTSAAAA